MARPMPRVEPLTSARFPDNCRSMMYSFEKRALRRRLLRPVKRLICLVQKQPAIEIVDDRLGYIAGLLQ